MDSQKNQPTHRNSPSESTVPKDGQRTEGQKVVTFKESPGMSLEQAIFSINETLQAQERERKIQAASFPDYDYRTTFREWAREFARIAHGQLGMDPNDMIAVAIRKLTDYAGLVAASEAKKHPNDWNAFVQAVGRHMPVYQEQRDYKRLVTRQEQAPDSDFDIYAYIRRDALREAMPGISEPQMLSALLVGLEPAYFYHLLPLVESGTIKTTDQFIEKGNEYKRNARSAICRCHITPQSQFSQQAGKGQKTGHNFLTNDNFYAQAQRPAIEQPSAETKAITRILCERQVSQSEHLLGDHYTALEYGHRGDRSTRQQQKVSGAQETNVELSQTDGRRKGPPCSK